MFRSQFYDHHQGLITVLVKLLLISVRSSSYSGLWLYVVRTSVRTMYEGHLESKERSRIQPAQLFQCS
jgi:hypothetical protein